jgi:catechol 2,3-dioxygenase-like lactoylglutathione lyase family enzyme
MKTASFTFNHIALSVKDVDVSIAFYQNVFQFKEIRNTASESQTRWLSLHEGKQLHLIPRPDSNIKTDKAVHFAFAANDFNSFVKHLETLKIEYSDWRDTPNKDYIRKDGIRQVYFQDPNGYWIEVNDSINE